MRRHGCGLGGGVGARRLWVLRAGTGMLVVSLWLAGCASMTPGSAQRAPGATSTSDVPPATSSALDGPARPDPQAPAATAERWSGDVTITGSKDEIPSPTGDLVATVAGGEVCLRRGDGPERCVLSLDGDGPPRFSAFSPSGRHLLVIHGSEASRSVHAIDVDSGVAQGLGAGGPEEHGSRQRPTGWELSSAAWSADSAAVLLLPRTSDAEGPLISVDVATGRPTELLRLPARLVNSAPSLWTSRTGVAVVGNTAEERGTLWWADFETRQVRAIGVFPEPGGQFVLGSADPLGRTVVVCPMRPNGAVGAAVAVSIADDESGPLLPGSRTCAASAFSPDGRYVAVADQMADGYSLAVVEPALGATRFRVRLPFPAPSTPPYATWAGEVIMLTDVTGAWALPTIVTRLSR